MQQLVPLKLLTAGQVALVGQVLGDPGAVQRLAELGMRLGARVQMLQHGSPCIVRLPSGKFCFRDNEAMSILVEVSPAA